jgi:hypothetical protein
VKIQRKFLWGAIRSGSNLCWVKWEVVLSRNLRGCLGVRDLRRVNISLKVWKSILAVKYGNNIIGQW